MKNSSIVLAALIALTAGASNALADDIAPPWWRYKDPDPVANRSTLQHWEFGNNETDPIADAVYTAPPETLAPQAVISPADAWIDEHYNSARQGIWTLSESPSSGLINLFISNYSGGPEKKIWVQLTWMPIPQLAPLISDGAPVIVARTSSSITPVSGDLLTEQSVGEDWIHSTYLIVVRPNPEFESVTISGDILIDSVVVDTICPEPGTLLALGVGIPFILRIRGKRGNPV
jgi:hypothetical protein